jgi:hypothetical protein
MVRRRAARLGVVLGAAWLAAGCVEDTPALFIVHNSQLDTSCAPVTRGNPVPFQGSGTLDVTVASEYWMFPRVENLMSPSGSVSLGRTGGTTTGGTRYEGNRVTLRQAVVSFRTPSGFDVAMPRNLKIPLSGTLDPNGNVVTHLRVINSALVSQLRASPQLAERSASVPVTVEVRLEGESTSGTGVESNVFTYPLSLCRGCLLQFPAAADDPDVPGFDCLAGFGEGAPSLDAACYPGQDSPLDCRLCHLIVTSSGGDPQQCEPRAGL